MDSSSARGVKEGCATAAAGDRMDDAAMAGTLASENDETGGSTEGRREGK